MGHPLFDLLDRIGLAAPAIDLCPAGNPRLDTVAGEITLDHFLIEPVLGLGLEGVGARADERQLATNNIDELRQLIEARLADKAPHTGHPRVVSGDEPLGILVRRLDIHRAELEDLDELVVEAIALLAEEDGAPAVELDGQSDEGHEGRCE